MSLWTLTSNFSKYEDYINQYCQNENFLIFNIYIFIIVIQLFLFAHLQVKIPLYGCDCYAYALLSSGFVDLVVESGLKVCCTLTFGCTFNF